MKKRRIAVLFFLSLIFAGIGCMLKELYTSFQKAAERSYKHGIYYNLYDKWISLREEGLSLGNYLVENQVFNIAIYGMGMLGNHFVKDLRNSGRITIAYGIDRSVENTEENIRMYKPEECLPPVDLIVVTAIFSFDEVAEMLRRKTGCPVVSLEEIIKEAWQEREA